MSAYISFLPNDSLANILKGYDNWTLLPQSDKFEYEDYIDVFEHRTGHIRRLKWVTRSKYERNKIVLTNVYMGGPEFKVYYKECDQDLVPTLKKVIDVYYLLYNL